MPPHHHHHHHHHQQQSSHCCCWCCTTSCNHCCNSSPSPSPLPPTTSDHLLQLLATHLLLQPQPQNSNLYLKPHHIHHSHQHDHRRHNADDPETKTETDPETETETQSLLHSLRRRIAALESSTRPRSPPLPPPPPPPPPLSLRDLAAATIQSAFRRFLLRRSQSLRHLKRLAALKSQAAALRSSLSDNRRRLDHKALSQRATDLLLELDSIQSGDPMIREGRRAIGRELARILDFVDKVLAREQELSIGAMENAVSTKPVRRVSFAHNGEAENPFSVEVIDGGWRNGEVDHKGWEASDDEKSSQGFVSHFHGENGNEGLSPPLPVQMELI